MGDAALPMDVIPLGSFRILAAVLSDVVGASCLGLSDALMVATPPSERDAHTFNLIMVVVFYTGIAAFIADTSKLADRSRVWLATKLAVLIGYWGSVIYLGD